MSDETTLETKGLDKLVKALKRDPPQARVGILGSKAARSATGKVSASNATIGAVHEFGAIKIPQRSFLRMPLSEHLGPRIEKSGAADKDVLAEVIASGTMVPWLQKIAILAESIVHEAFDTGGFGKWKPSDMKNKKNQQTLVETQQLRNSITWDVK